MKIIISGGLTPFISGGLTPFTIPVVWSTSSTNVEFSESSGGAILTQSQLEETEREFIWVKSDQGGMYEISAASSVEGAVGTAVDFLVANFYVDTSPLDFLRETTYDLQVKSDPGWAVSLVEMEVDPVSESYWWVEWDKSTNKISLENLIEKSAVEKDIDEVQAKFFLKLGGAFEWTFQKIPFVKDVNFKKHLLGIYPLIKNMVIDEANAIVNSPGDMAKNMVRDNLLLVVEPDSQGLLRELAGFRIDEAADFAESKFNKWFYEDLLKVLIWAEIDESSLEQEVVSESFALKFHTPELNLNLVDFSISSDLGSTAGDLIKAVNENGWSDLDFGYEDLNIDFEISGNGEVGFFDLDVGVKLRTTFDSEWYHDGNFYTGDIEVQGLLFFRLQNKRD